MRTASVEETLALWTASLREIKQRILPLFKQERVATDAGLLLEGLLADEQRRTGWMRLEAGGDPGPWRQQAILGRRWDATGESSADVAMQRQRSQKDDSEAVSDWRYVGLMPLAPEEIKAFAVRQGYRIPRHRLTISTSATRRTRLSGRRTSSNHARIDQITTHIRSHGEQVETNVINKPKPRGRKEKAELSAERAQEGRRVWRAALLKRKFMIRNSVGSNNTAGYGPCIACRPHSDRLVADHCAVGPELLRSIQEVGFVQQLPHFRMQRSFV